MRNRALALLVWSFVGGIVPANAAPRLQLPDLVPLPAYDIVVSGTERFVPPESIVVEALGYRYGRLRLHFATTIVNRGRYSLELIGTPKSTGDRADPVRVAAAQCVRFTGPAVLGAPRVCEATTPAGSLVYHPQHGHFHLDGFAQYSLLRDRKGRPDTSARGVVARSEKIGFCMADMHWMGGGNLPVEQGWYRECAYTAPSIPLTVRQGISPGWSDSYGVHLENQWISIDKVPDGIYWIAITLNPPQLRHLVNLRETSRANNTSYRRIKLQMKAHDEVITLD